MKTRKSVAVEGDYIKGLISVVVPIYNVADYLDRCISSICAQKYSKLQIILVDDGSTDGSGAICDSYKMKDGRILCIHQINRGVTAARRAGIEAANGEYIGFVDGDDYIDDDMYESLYRLIVRENADVAESCIKRDGVKWLAVDSAVIDMDENRQDKIKDMFLTCKLQKIKFALWNKLFRSDVIRKAYRGVTDNVVIGEDCCVVMRVLLICSRLVITDKAYYNYTVRSGSSTQSVNVANMTDYNAMYCEMINAAKEFRMIESLKPSIDYIWITNVMSVVLAEIPEMMRIHSCTFIEKLHGKKIVLYGAGDVGRDYYRQLRLYDDIDIVGWVDKNADNIECEYRDIAGVNDIIEKDYDYIVVAVFQHSLAELIMKDLCGMGISRKKMVWSRPVRYEELVMRRMFDLRVTDGPDVRI